MTTEIVIARYNENLDWIKLLDKNIKITIYNKGEPIDYPSIKLPNIGRESHTYLYHIINNYNKLADKTIFCQGDSIFHSPDFIKLIKNRNLFEPIQPLSAYYWPEGEPPKYLSNPPKVILNETKYLWIKKKYHIHVEYLDYDFQTKYPFYYREYYFQKMVEFLKIKFKTDNILEYLIKKLNLKNVNSTELFPICYAGLFSVDKKIILENSLEFYKNIQNVLINEKVYITDNKQLDWGLFLEKLWLVIFNYKKNNKYCKSVNNYKLFNPKLIIKNNKIDFNIYVIYSQIYIYFNLDNDKWSIYLSKGEIFLRLNKKTLH